MPRLVSLHDRATCDLHADWWSDKKDERGRFVERAVIYAEYLQADAQAVQAKLLGGAKFDPAKLQKAAQSRDASDLGFNLDGAEKQDMYLFQQVCVEMTDEDGVRLPIEDEETFVSMLQRDAEFITGEIRKLTQPLIQPTEIDAEMALATASATTGGKKPKSAQVVAEENFRRRRETRDSAR